MISTPDQKEMFTWKTWCKKYCSKRKDMNGETLRNRCSNVRWPITSIDYLIDLSMADCDLHLCWIITICVIILQINKTSQLCCVNSLKFLFLSTVNDIKLKRNEFIFHVLGTLIINYSECCITSIVLCKYVQGKKYHFFDVICLNESSWLSDFPCTLSKTLKSS